MSTLNTILDNLVSRLKTIKKSSGYNNTLENVYRYTIPYDSGDELAPWATVIETDDNILFEDSTRLRAQSTVVITLVVKADEDLSLYLNKFIDDIKKLIYAPISLGGNCYTCTIERIDRLYLGEGINRAVASITLNIHYYMTKAAP